LIPALLLALSGCSVIQHAGLATITNDILTRSHSVRHIPVQADVKYLLMTQEKRESLLVWIGNEFSARGAVSVWISADGVVVRLGQDGQLVGVSEKTRNWQIYSQALLKPANQDSEKNKILEITDTQPGYRLGVKKQIQKLKLESPIKNNPWYLNTNKFSWSQLLETSTGEILSIYGQHLTDSNHMAGQRCIDKNWCLRWQTWPANYN
jgi:hypothetical protein